MHKFIYLLVLVTLVSCSKKSNSDLSLQKQVDNLVSNKKFNEAIKLTNEANPALIRNIDSLRQIITIEHGNYFLSEADTKRATGKFMHAYKIDSTSRKAKTLLENVLCSKKFIDDIADSTFTITKCSKFTLAQTIDQLIAEDNYEQALTMIKNANPEETEADINLLKEKVHLNYGIYLEYRGPESSSMRDRMTSALQQYIEVLKLNKQNQKAISEIEQIMGIYQTMPDNSPSKEIIAELNKLGFDY